MKTAVEYLVNAWVEQGTLYAEDIVKAKEMEKQQIIDFAENWSKQILRSDRNTNIQQYYNETFKSE